MLFPDLYIHDFEVFAHDWFMVAKEKGTDRYLRFHNQPWELAQFIQDTKPMLAGFNNKHYDSFILRAILNGLTPEQVKAVNDKIIVEGKQGWEIPEVRNCDFWFDQYDLMDDCQLGMSLKAIEAHLGMDIRETTVDFTIDRPLTEEECEEVFFYCTHDVDATDMLDDLRQDYLRNKIKLGEEKGIKPERAVYMTNAKLTAAFLDAHPPAQPWTDERQYKPPATLLTEYIPEAVLDFFQRMYDGSIPDEELFKESLELEVGGCPCKIAYGGIHGAIPNYIERAEGERTIRNKDVASYYPHQMVLNGYCSRNIPSPQIYIDTIERRVKAKKSGDKATANALKLVLNTTYGAMLNRFNDLYDPLMGRSVCISGQLQLLELAEHCVKECPTLKIIQLNTDGIMVSLDNSDEPKWQEITSEWERRTGFELEEDFISAIYQKDVNNYIEVPMKGEPKIKGGYLVRGIAPAGAFKVNNDACCVARAIVAYFTENIDPADYISSCDDLKDFQIIAKAGSKYKEAYHLIDGEKVPVQKVNRVYAAKDERYGKLFKIKAENDSEAKIATLPEHCIIDNDNHISIEDINKGFYIEIARKRINDFLGIQPEKKGRKMATTKETPAKLNVYQKLLLARKMFLDKGVQKSGKNMQLAFHYFELDDIVPVVTEIFSEVGLIGCVDFTETTASIAIIDTDICGDERKGISFSLPFKVLEPIVSNTGKKATNEMQALGSSITYMRRYLYMVAMDICEADSIDSDISEQPVAPTVTIPTPVVHAPVSEAERKGTTIKLTAVDGPASELQIRQLKDALKRLVAKDATKEETVQQISLATKSFTEITKADCEGMLKKIAAMLEE